MTIEGNDIKLDEKESVELMTSGYIVDQDLKVCIVDIDGEYLVFERKQFVQLSIYDFLEEE